jgi:LacI family transcriptional regulator
MTMGTIQAILDLGVRRPENASIAGIDDFSWSATIQPRLTTVVQPMEEMGKVTVAGLLERLDPRRVAESRLPQLTVLTPRLLVRDPGRRLPAHAGGAG